MITKRAFESLLMAVMVTGAAALPAVGQDQVPTPTPARSLYARLGGYDFVAKFVDTAFPRVAGHPQLRRLFQGHSQDSQVRQRQLIVDALCQAAGGPCAYTGRAMKPVHTGLGITTADWTVFIGILTGALEELKAAPPERKEFLDLLDQRFKAGVVETR
jgi:hemoglobin